MNITGPGLYSQHDLLNPSRPEGGHSRTPLPVPLPPALGHCFSHPLLLGQDLSNSAPTPHSSLTAHQRDLRPWVSRAPPSALPPCLLGHRAGPGAGGTHLCGGDGSLADAPVDRVPGPGRQHAGEQGVEVTGSQALAVLPHALHVGPDQRLPEAAVVQAELFCERLWRGAGWQVGGLLPPVKDLVPARCDRREQGRGRP